MIGSENSEHRNPKNLRNKPHKPYPKKSQNQNPEIHVKSTGRLSFHRKRILVTKSSTRLKNGGKPRDLIEES